MANARPLYELAAGFNAIFDLVLDETMDLEQLEGALQSIECEVEEKCANGIALIKSLETYAVAYKAEKKRFEAQQQSLENRIKLIKEWYRQNLDAIGKSKVPTKYGVMSVQGNGGLFPLKIDDEKLTPAEYLATIPEHKEVDRDKLYKALETGGCYSRRTFGAERTEPSDSVVIGRRKKFMLNISKGKIARPQLPELLELDYKHIAHLFSPGQFAPKQETQSAEAPAPQAKPAPQPTPAKEVAPEDESAADILRGMLKEKGVTEEELRQVLKSRGREEANVSLDDFTPEFVFGYVIRYWEQIMAIIEQNRTAQK